MSQHWSPPCDERARKRKPDEDRRAPVTPGALGWRRRALLVALLLPAWLLPIASHGQDAAGPLRPPTNLRAEDRPNDVGNAVILEWALSPDDGHDPATRRVLQYEIYRRATNDPNGDGAFRKIGEATFLATAYTDPNAERGQEYIYRITALSREGEESSPSAPSNAVTPVRQFFNTSKAWQAIILLLVCGAVYFFIEYARRGGNLRVRKIAGLEAVSEAVGRATEMGRPVLYINGIQDINDIQTIAGITILGNVARTCAEYDAQLVVPTSRSLVMTTARETVQNAFLAAGRPDAYREDNIYYLTDEQFGFVAGVTGTMVREKPAACFYMGAFYAEALVLAETGNGIGAIQVAGTAMPSQLPFFVAACDYTLIGEEFFAASAYLSGEPMQLGSLKGQDIGKVFGAFFIVFGCFVATAASLASSDGLGRVVSFLRDNMFGMGGFLP